MIKKIAYYSILLSIICIALNLTILADISFSIFSIEMVSILIVSLLAKNPFLLLFSLTTLILSILTLLQIKKNRITFPIIMIILYIIDLLYHWTMYMSDSYQYMVFLDIYYIIILVIYCFDPSRENNKK